MQSAERVSQSDASDNYVYQRSILAYHKAAGIVSGDVLEIGTGSGYGVAVVAPACRSFLTVDKTLPPEGTIPVNGNVEFRRINIPPLEGIISDSYDYVISFQVIEHIKKDIAAIKEIHRVLKPGGKLIITTPNRKMSLTRNPWHVREYTADEFKRLLSGVFSHVETLGVSGNEKVTEYYENNKRSVAAVTKYDVLKLQKWLPRWCLKIPYDIMNRRNRRKLLTATPELTSSICMEDYTIDKIENNCFDFFYIAQK